MSNQKLLSAKKQECDFKFRTTRDINRRFVVKLPSKIESNVLDETYDIALRYRKSI